MGKKYNQKIKIKNDENKEKRTGSLTWVDHNPGRQWSALQVRLGHCLEDGDYR